jgi:hypothetical protein
MLEIIVERSYKDSNPWEITLIFKRVYETCGENHMNYTMQSRKKYFSTGYNNNFKQH